MKRISDVVTINNLLDCYYDIKKNTKNRDKLVKYDMFISSNIINLYNKLISGKYRHGIYNIFLIYEPKLRVIMSENINDKIVSHLICKYYIIDIINKKLINSNIATRKNKGSSYGVKLIKKYINSIKLKHNKFYILKIDIKKYFFNIDHNILLSKLYSIVDKDIFYIIKNIIDSTNKDYVNDRISKLIDDSEYLYKHNKGLNIGSYISQILASFYLNDIDHFIKEKLGVKYYVRYVDDFVLIDYSYGYLLYCLEIIKKKLNELGLSINNKTRVYESKKGFCFLGYKFFLNDNNKLFVKVKYKNKIRIRRKLKHLKKHDIDKYKVVVNSYKGYFVVRNRQKCQKY